MNNKLSFKEMREITTPMKKKIIDECSRHSFNEVSAHTMQRKLHECRVMEYNCMADIEIGELIMKKSHFLEKYATHAEFVKVIAIIYDAEIAEILDSKNQSFEQFVALNPDYGMWGCRSFMARD